MRIMIDILHPAHVHFFRNLYFEMTKRGHELLVTSRSKDCATQLLDRFGIPNVRLSDSTRGSVRQLAEFITRSARFAKLARSFRPDVLTGIMGPTIATVGKLIRKPVYVFYDTEFAKTTNRFVYPLSTKVITPDCYQGEVGPNHVQYPGYHELAYLHPKRFQPSADVLKAAGYDPAEPYAVVRFVGWWATHDRHETGLTGEQKTHVAKTLEQYCRVVVTSETDVPAEIADRVYRGPLEDVHHLLAFASLYYGESATMASEAAVLGTPSIYIATTGRGYTDDEAKYGLVFDYRDTQFDESMSKVLELARDLGVTKQAAAQARKTLLDQKIDVTEYMLNLFEQDFQRSQVA